MKYRTHYLTRQERADIIEYWLVNPGLRMIDIGDKFWVSAYTISLVITRDYLGKVFKNPVVITRQSKINEPEFELLTIE